MVQAIVSLITLGVVMAEGAEPTIVGALAFMIAMAWFQQHRAMKNHLVAGGSLILKCQAQENIIQTLMNENEMAAQAVDALVEDNMALRMAAEAGGTE